MQPRRKNNITVNRDDCAKGGLNSVWGAFVNLCKLKKFQKRTYEANPAGENSSFIFTGNV